MSNPSGDFDLTIDGGSSTATDAEISGFIAPIDIDYTTAFLLGGM